MDKPLVGIVAFGNLKYTKLAVKYLKLNTTIPFDLFIVASKHGDGTPEWCEKQGINYISKKLNWGFPNDLNDIYDYAWMDGSQRHVIVMGNDVMPFPQAVDNLVAYADNSDFEWVSGIASATPRKFLRRFPKYKHLFNKDILLKENFNEWLELKPEYTGKVKDITNYGIIGDSHNLCLFKRSLFDKIGYVDVNFFPAYFEDNDYARRAQLAGTKMCRISDAPYFHFWSRTIYEAGNKKLNDKLFPENKKYYIKKWGGAPGKEKFMKPFNGAVSNSSTNNLPISIDIMTRDKEKDTIKYWRNKS